MSENQEYNKEKTETPGELENEIKKAVVGAEIIHETTKYTKESNGGKAETIRKQEAGQVKQTESQAKRYQKGETSTSFTSAATGAEGCQGVARFSGLAGCSGGRLCKKSRWRNSLCLKGAEFGKRNDPGVLGHVDK